MKLYLDIDGVLLTKSLTIPPHGKEFIHFMTENFDCYWLTTHCRGGENKAVKYLAQYYDRETQKQLESIKPTDWMYKKTEALDFFSDFIWLEDYPFEIEKNELKTHNKLDSLFIVDLNCENELRTVESKIKVLRDILR